jgi:hypothetical protein
MDEAKRRRAAALARERVAGPVLPSDGPEIASSVLPGDLRGGLPEVASE